MFESEFISACKAGDLSVESVSRLIKVFYGFSGNGAGGNLHLVLDDKNISKDNIAYCLECSIAEDDKLSEALCRMLLRMNYKDKRKAICDA